MQTCRRISYTQGLMFTPMGINAVGLRRAGLPDSDVSELKRAYRLLYRSGLKLAEAADRIASECRSSHARILWTSFGEVKEGFAVRESILCVSCCLLSSAWGTLCPRPWTQR